MIYDHYEIRGYAIAGIIDMEIQVDDLWTTTTDLRLLSDILFQSHKDIQLFEFIGVDYSKKIDGDSDKYEKIIFNIFRHEIE